MKIFNLTTLALGFLLLNAASCTKDNGTLPPETQEGKNTFGCLVNEKVWLYGGFSFPRTNLGITIDENQFSIYALKVDNKINQTVSVYIKSPLAIGFYKLNDINHIAKFIDEESNCYYQTDSISSTGTLEITKYDSINKIVSGNFSFKALKFNPDNNENIISCDSIVSITDGRFDIKIIP